MESNFAIIEFRTKDNVNSFICLEEKEIATQEAKLSKEYATILRIVRDIKGVDKLTELAEHVQDRLSKGMMIQ